MKTRLPALLLLVAVVTACATPQRTYYEVATQYRDIVNSLAEARRDGTIDKRAGDKIDPVIKAGHALLTRWYEEIAATPEGETPDIGRATVNGMLDILAQLSTWYARYKGGQ